jgi:translation initiation factor 2 subunit 2
MDYEKMLDNAQKELKCKTIGDDRFCIPAIESLIQGKKTIIKNIGVIAKTLHRDLKHISKFFIKETGVPTVYDNQKLILNGIFNNYKIKQIYEKYINEYVKCKECDKYDTKLKNEKGIQMMKCEACGALSAIKKI